MLERVKARLKYWIIIYLLLYFAGLMMTGIPNVYYLIPLKVVPILGVILLGNQSYYLIEEGVDRYLCALRTIKYIPLVVAIIFIILLIHKAFFYDSIELTLLFGFPI